MSVYVCISLSVSVSLAIPSCGANHLGFSRLLCPHCPYKFEMFIMSVCVNMPVMGGSHCVVLGLLNVPTVCYLLVYLRNGTAEIIVYAA